jgi:FkbM family methyltransferase
VRRRGIQWELDLTEGIDLAIYLLGGFERSVMDQLTKLVPRGGVAFDVGANVGAVTLPLAQIVGESGRVYAFEPTEFACRKLSVNVSLNPELAQRIHVEELFFDESAEATSPAEVYASWPVRRLDRAESVHPRHRGRAVSAQNARVVTLDAFAEEEHLDRLDFIKLDVDGNELKVLNGARDTLRRFRPPILMELAPYVLDETAGELEALVEFLRSLDLEPESLPGGERLPLDADFMRRFVPDGAGINVIARAAGAKP